MMNLNPGKDNYILGLSCNYPSMLLLYWTFLCYRSDFQGIILTCKLVAYP